MNRLVRSTLLPVAAVAVFAACTGVSYGSTGPSTINITSTQTMDRYVDGGGDGPGIGDREVIRQSLYNRRVTQTPIGRAEIVCTFLGGGSRSCLATYFLPKGKIVTGGAIGTRLLYETAVLGGTGLFDNARGLLVVTATSLSPRREILVFRLTG
jgi:hypothetical protein